MKKMMIFAVGLIIAGGLLFVAGVFDVFDLHNYREGHGMEIYFAWLGIPLLLMGFGLTTFIMYQNSKEK